MLIKDLRNKETDFANLREGEVAYIPKDGTYIMRIVPIYCSEDKRTYNAIDLQDGDALSMDSDEVVRVTATLTIEEA
jgi:hypothetical protein